MLRANWFLIVYVAVVALAWLWPGFGRSGGLIHLDAAKSACIAGIFLCAGLTLPWRQLTRAAGAWREHLAVQSVAFAITPALALAVAWLGGRLGLGEAAQLGIIVLGCLPTTIGSCVAITGMAGGNQGIALVNSVVGNLIGIALTPLLVLWLTGHSPAGGLGSVFGQLLLLAVLPVALGQIVRLRLAAVLDPLGPALNVTASSLLLVVVLVLFSDLNGHIPDGALGGILAAVIALFLLSLAAGGAAARLASTLPRDRIAIAITASQKTGALGIPLIGLLFAGSPDLTLLILPVALYHAAQQFIGAGIAPWIRPQPAA